MATVEPHDELVKADEIEVGSDERELCSSVEPRSNKPENELVREAEAKRSLKECKRYASDNFFDRITTMIPEEELQKILRHQKDALAKFEKTNEKFGKFNELSEARFEALHLQFKNNTKVLVDMKKDLDSIFRRIRMLKVKLGKQFEEAFAAREQQVSLHDEEEAE